MPGWRQRLKRARDNSSDAHAHVGSAHDNKCEVQQSALATSLTKDWCWGVLSAPKLLEYINSEIKDQGINACPVLHSLAASSELNMHRHLVNCFKGFGFGKLIEDLPLSLVTQIVPPHLLMGYICKHQEQFERCLGAQATQVHKFWVGLYESHDGHKLFMEHAQLIGKTPDDMVHVLPLVIHEDAGPYAKSRSCVEVSWSSLLGEGPEKECKFLSFTYLKETKAEMAHKFPNRAWRSFIDSLAMLASKVHPPESRLAGTPLAADSTGTIWGGIALFAKGDGEQLMEWGLPSTSTPDQICGFCMANRTTMPYTDLRPSATWWPTEIGTTVAFKERLKRPHHPLIDAPFFTFWFFRLDIMHLWDCKGLWPIMMGGALWLLVHKEVRLGASMSQRLQTINERRLAFYSRNKVLNIMPKIRINNLTNGDGFADLCGPAIKAANSRSLVPFVAELVMEFMDSGSVYHKAIQKMFKSAKSILDLLYRASMFLSFQEKLDLKSDIMRLGKYFQLAQTLASADAEPLWHLTPKVHQTMHIPKQASLINPVVVQCYKDESFVGVVTKSGMHKLQVAMDCDIQVLAGTVTLVGHSIGQS